MMEYEKVPAGFTAGTASRNRQVWSKPDYLRNVVPRTIQH